MDNTRRGENTYKLEPPENERFYPSQVKKCIEEVVVSNLKDKMYQASTAHQIAMDITDKIKERVKLLSIPSYKVVVQTIIGEVLGQGVRVASKCLWDDKNDNYASFSYNNGNLFCVGIVFGFYYE